MQEMIKIVGKNLYVNREEFHREIQKMLNDDVLPDHEEIFLKMLQDMHRMAMSVSILNGQLKENLGTGESETLVLDIADSFANEAERSLEYWEQQYLDCTHK